MKSFLKAVTAAAALTFATTALAAPTRPQLRVTAYVIHAELDPASSRLSATTAVTFTALEDLSTPTFELNNGLALTSVTDSAQHTLTSERLSTQNAVRFTLATAIPKGTSTTWTFTYSGALTGSDTSPVEGIKLAAVADPISMLLYPGRWFPISQTGLYTDRFTAEMHIRVPSDERVVASGPVGTPVSVGKQTEYSFNWTKPGFPGTVVAGKFLAPQTVGNFKIYVTEKRKLGALAFGETAAKEFEFMSTTFGQPETGAMSIVELPEDGVSASWGPGIAAIAGNRIMDHNSARLLANTLAHQWWGSEVSPATLNDAWITNGMSRYAELMYVEDASGSQAFQTAVGDVSAGALAYDTEPLSTLGRLDPFSPQFQSMTLEKGAMVFHMLRWEMGNEGFTRFLRETLSQYTDKGIRSRDLETVAEAQNRNAGGEQSTLQPFFSQWVDGTGAPQFNDKYTVYRLGNNKGFRTVGAITQDLDLFRMPVELRIETEGKTETRRVDVAGTDSQYEVETFGRPRRITIDPQGWLLKTTPDLAVKVAVLRGQQLVAQGDLTGALVEYQKALDANKNSSLAAYRIGEIFFNQHNFQSAANSFRDSLRGDGDPKWTEVWSHVELGRIFDVTGQRERAVNEYRLAVQTNDNTQGAINEARNLMIHPYTRTPTDN
ncbi:M1 family aminopeptidase [Granulicella tundricola]|uniref:Peptidase M1 membrane alanine aminopeptidase n=1 Tax=Granulicella tundricola (strain ATCC BAA-1859 / DSM 23138 / MP5ACTX9) TaxID=1198114 RepID=E8X4H1_GRATM|nr:M1 family aminopeptidase [Granulicella tundricola]ADW68298.1 Peptidase M1 membrane alanine aminopeptidase [Granulicella tundricola MP5ACTX9]